MSSGNKPGDIRILGPANKKMAKGPDVSNLRPPIHTSLTGMKQAVHVLETGTLEVKRTLVNEANLIYECKVCLSMFRSIANLVAHKRTFCRNLYSGVKHVFSDQEDKENCSTVVVEPEEADCCSDLDTWNMDNYSPSMDLIRTTGIIGDILNAPLVDKLKPTSINSVIHKLSSAAAKDPTSVFRTGRQLADRPPHEEARLVLEPVYNTSNALYQSWKVTSDEESIRDIHSDLNKAKFLDKHVIIVGDDHGAPPEEEEDVQTQAGTAKPKEGQAGDDMVERYPCLWCTNHYSSWTNLRRHIVQSHKKTPEYANSKRAEMMDKPFLAPKSARSNSVYCNPFTAPALVPQPAPSTLSPVKKVRIDLKKVPLDLSKFCASVEPSNDGCPVLKTKIGHAPVPPPASSLNAGRAPVSRILDKIVEQQEEPQEIPADVEKKIMEGINRRHLQCTTCFKRFRRTVLAQQHVAGTHLKLHRFKCTVCDFGAWKRSHVVRHAEKSHRSRTNQEHVIEQPKEVYFAKYEHQEPKPPGGTLLNHNFGDIDLRNQNGSVCGIGCGKPVKGVSSTLNDDVLPVNLINDIRSQVSVLEDEQSSDGSEVTFNCSPKKKRKRLSSLSSEASEIDKNNTVGLVEPTSVAPRTKRSTLWSPSKSVQPEEKCEKSFRGVRGFKGGEDDIGLDKSGRSTRQRASVKLEQ